MPALAAVSVLGHGASGVGPARDKARWQVEPPRAPEQGLAVVEALLARYRRWVALMTLSGLGLVTVCVVVGSIAAASGRASKLPMVAMLLVFALALALTVEHVPRLRRFKRDARRLLAEGQVIEGVMTPKGQSRVILVPTAAGERELDLPFGDLPAFPAGARVQTLTHPALRSGLIFVDEPGTTALATVSRARRR